MNEVNTILWPTDLSDASLKAAPQVQGLSQKYGARVIVMYVGTDLCSFFPAYGNYPSSHVIKDFQDFEMKEARKKLEEVCDKHLQACPNFEISLVAGHPAEKILDQIKECGVDLVVMGTRGDGLNRAESSALGPITQEVLAKSPVPVMTVNP